MYDPSDDDVWRHHTAYATPPLSPTKTISTEGWPSPRTPGSPRKARSCGFMQHVHSADDDFFTSPPSSPTRPKIHPYLDRLPVLRLLTACEATPSHPDDDSPTKNNIPTSPSQCHAHQTNTLARLRSCSLQGVDQDQDSDALSSSSQVKNHNLPLNKEIASSRQHHIRSSSENFVTPTNRPLSRSTSNSSILVTDDRPHDLSNSNAGQATEDSSSTHCHPPTLQTCFPPLRLSQWAVREGLSPSPTRTSTSTPDRFIAGRRPPAVTRDSFKLSKHTQRLELERSIRRGARVSPDEFSRRLRRSRRLNDELRGLRDAHSVIIGRVGVGRRNATFRYGLVPLGARQISAGAVWNVGGPSAVSDTVIAVSTGHGSLLGRGTNAPLYRSAFLNGVDPEAEFEAYERRLALALDIDQTDRILQHSPAYLSPQASHQGGTIVAKHVWRDGVWIKDGAHSLLDAPQLRDDYYCTLLAYCHTSRCLAVGLGNFVHLWSEKSGVETPESLNALTENGASEIQHVTSLHFSSIQGKQAILAVGRADGRISLWSSFDSEPRFDACQPKPISCLSWRPTTVQRPSLRDRALDVSTEELLVGDEVGHIYIYSVEWPSETQSAIFGWHGAMTLLARLTIHTQQICGLTWSIDGELFASGGNDNNCYLFETKKALASFQGSRENPASVVDVREGGYGESIFTVNSRPSPIFIPLQASAKHKWKLNAAVKAIAFCPWQRSLIAISGGSNDRCIHFYHTRSGACLATIDCAAQVTSLIWSHTRREIAATFGFTQPEHPYRIAVFAWPSCEQVVAVPWWDENRALCAIAYPGGPTTGPRVDEEVDSTRETGRDGLWPSRRRVEEGCIVVATSDMAIRFHEIWSDNRGTVCSGNLTEAGTGGLLGEGDLLGNPYSATRGEPVMR